MSDASIFSIPLIPRKMLFGNATRISPKLSPDGKRLAWQAPVDGVMNIWVAPVDRIESSQPVTRMKGRPPIFHEWSPDGRHIFFLKDENGDENHRLFAVAPEGGEIRNLTPIPRVATHLHLWSPDKPDRVYVGLNDRDARWHDVWEIDLATGMRALIYENSGRFGGFNLDWQGRLRLATRSIPNGGGVQIFRFGADPAKDEPEPWLTIPFENSLGTWPMFFNRAGTHFNMLSSIGRNTSALLRIDMTTEEQTVVAEHPKADLGTRIWDPSAVEVRPLEHHPTGRKRSRRHCRGEAGRQCHGAGRRAGRHRLLGDRIRRGRRQDPRADQRWRLPGSTEAAGLDFGG